MAGAGGPQASAASPSPSSSASQLSTVCCMCGDLGLLEELFRCKDCFFRSQHKYCSELYPKSEACRSCNWCLREERGKSFPASEPMSDGSSSSSSTAGDALNRLKLQREVPLLQLCIKPVKKLRVTKYEVPASKSLEETAAGAGRARQVFRGKARRYKLLEEVSS